MRPDLLPFVLFVDFVVLSFSRGALTTIELRPGGDRR